MKRYLLFISLLVMGHVGASWAVSTPVLITAQTYSDCVATCGYTHCCTKGENFTTYTCPTGWTYDSSTGVCVRDPLVRLAATAHRYTITRYTTCAADTTVAEGWFCASGITGDDWIECCVLKSDGTCSTVSLM